MVVFVEMILSLRGFEQEVLCVIRRQHFALSSPGHTARRIKDWDGSTVLRGLLGSLDELATTSRYTSGVHRGRRRVTPQAGLLWPHRSCLAPP